MAEDYKCTDAVCVIFPDAGKKAGKFLKNGGMETGHAETQRHRGDVQVPDEKGKSGKYVAGGSSNRCT